MSSDDDTLRAEIMRAKVVEAAVKVEYGVRLASMGLLSTSAQLLASAIDDLSWVLGLRAFRGCGSVCVERPSRRQVSRMLRAALKLMDMAESKIRLQGQAARVYASIRSKLRVEAERALARLCCGEERAP